MPRMARQTTAPCTIPHTPHPSHARCTGTPSKCNSDGKPQYYSGCDHCPFSHPGGYWGCTKKWGCNEGWSVPAPRLSSQLLRPLARNIVAACLPAATPVVTPIGLVPAATTAATPVAIFLTSTLGFPLAEAEDADRLQRGGVRVVLCLSLVLLCLSCCACPVYICACVCLYFVRVSCCARLVVLVLSLVVLVFCRV